MDLNSLINSIRNFEGITRKNLIKDITSRLEETYNISGKTLLGFGDDASALEIGNSQVLLMATDGMWGKLMEADPWWAGYCSVLVNVNDIAAMGGKPLGMTNVLSVKDKDICSKIMDGINEGVKKFGVPMVGGHVHPDAPYNSLDVSITGIMNREDIITSCGAKPGHKVLVAIDLDGKIHPQFHLNWDTTTMKSPELVQAQVKAMNELASKHLVSAGKDISNPGTLGTLGMLLEASNVGSTIQLELIPRKHDISWEDWLLLYPGAGFILTAEETKVEEITEILEKVNITTSVVGDITSDKKLYLSSENDKQLVFDFNSDKIMGIQEEKP